MNANATPALASTGRAALYLRVSTGRQAENDLSIPDQRRQLQSYCQAKGLAVAAEFVEPGASATDDRRPEFQKMMDAATQKPALFDTIIVHSFSRFFAISSNWNFISAVWRRTVSASFRSRRISATIR